MGTGRGRAGLLLAVAYRGTEALRLRVDQALLQRELDRRPGWQTELTASRPTRGHATCGLTGARAVVPELLWWSEAANATKGPQPALVQGSPLPAAGMHDYPGCS